MSRSAGLGSTTNSLTKASNRDGLKCKKGQKEADGHSGIIRVPTMEGNTGQNCY